MCDTPRTDALDDRTCAFGEGYRLAVHADLCRELERENAALFEQNISLVRLIAGIKMSHPHLVPDEYAKVEGDES